MATPTYEAIATITLTSSASSITFSSIPQNYADLILAVNFKLNSDSTVGIRFNGDSGSNYKNLRMFGTGSSAISDTRTLSSADFETGNASNNFNTSIVQIMDYSSTDKYKSVFYRANQNIVGAGINSWENTSAITSFEIIASGGYATGCTFSLYGIEA